MSRRHPPLPALRRLAVGSLAALALASPAAAQHRVAPTGVHTIADGRGRRVLRHAVNGALIGLGITTVVAIVAAEVSEVKEGVPPVFIVPVGAVVGATVGTVVGLVRTRPRPAAPQVPAG